MSVALRILLFCLLVWPGPTGCKAERSAYVSEPPADARPEPAKTCPKVGDAIELADQGWTVKLLSFRFFRDIGADAHVVQAGSDRVFALAEVEWTATGRSGASSAPPLALWDGRGNRYERTQDALDAFLRMQPGGRYGVLQGGPTDRFLDAVVFILPPDAARHGLWLAGEAPRPPLDSQPRFCLGPYDVR
jgi:hypothetical protein